MLPVKLPPRRWFLTLPVASLVTFVGLETLLWARHFGIVGGCISGCTFPFDNDPLPNTITVFGYVLFQESEVLTIYNVTKVSLALGLLIGGKVGTKEWVIGLAFAAGFLGGAKAWDDFHDWADMLLGLTTAVFALYYLKGRVDQIVNP